MYIMDEDEGTNTTASMHMLSIDLPPSQHLVVFD